jgi:chemotaxis protein MotB
MSRRKKKHEEHENHERWLVSYADFITLLFAFFVVLYATSTQNEEKEKKFEESIRAELKMTVVGVGAKSTDSGGMFGNVIDPIEAISEKRLGNQDLEEAFDKLLERTLSEEEKKTSVSGLRHDGSGVRIALSASTFFPVGSAKLRLKALSALDKMAPMLKQANRKIIVEGHTDDLPIQGGQFESNWELASLRATSVVRYLIKFHEIDPQKIAAISYADTKPVAPNTNEENRSKNRRIEILVVNGSE